MTELAIYGEARDRINRIKGHITAAWADIVEAYRKRDWITLGYADWDAMCETEFGGARINLPIAERQQIVADLRGEGLSTRAIGSAIGVNHATVVRDIAATGADAPVETVLSQDGRQRPAKAKVTTTTVETVDVETGEILPAASAARGGPPKRHRRPLVDELRDATHDLVKATERVERLLGDDRYPRNAEQAAASMRGDLLRAAESLSRAISQLTVATPVAS